MDTQALLAELQAIRTVCGELPEAPSAASTIALVRNLAGMLIEEQTEQPSVELRSKVIPMSATAVTAGDIAFLVEHGIDNEALVILYESTHDRIQRLLIEEIAGVRGVSLVPELIAA